MDYSGDRSRTAPRHKALLRVSLLEALDGELDSRFAQLSASIDGA